jgi:hypothetical protein
MPAERRPGYDQPYLPTGLAPDRDPARFAGPLAGTAVAVLPVLLLEVYEDPVPDWPQYRSVAGGLERAFPNISRVSTREYGHRVGIFRLVGELTDRGIRPTVAIDAMTAERYPRLVQWLAAADVEWVAHGISVTRPIGEWMSEDEEHTYVAETLLRLEASGVSSQGWLGPEYGESSRTPRILAASGVRHVMDWTGDERPLALGGTPVPITAMPMNADLDDQTALANRMLDPEAYGTHLTDAVARLALDGQQDARVLGIAFRPWLTGQPFRARQFVRLLDAVSATEHATITTPMTALQHFTDRPRSAPTAPERET